MNVEFETAIWAVDVGYAFRFFGAARFEGCGFGRNSPAIRPTSHNIAPQINHRIIAANSGG